MGEIYHSWNGTVLTITSDSGTSSADLKGDMGIRGPQGVAGGSTEHLEGLEQRVEDLESMSGGYVSWESMHEEMESALATYPNFDYLWTNYYSKEEIDAKNALIVTVNGTTPSSTNAEIHAAAVSGREIYLQLWSNTYIKATYIAPSYTWFEGTYLSTEEVDGKNYNVVKYRLFTIENDKYKQNSTNLAKLDYVTALEKKVAKLERPYELIQSFTTTEDTKFIDLTDLNLDAFYLYAEFPIASTGGGLNYRVYKNNSNTYVYSTWVSNAIHTSQVNSFGVYGKNERGMLFVENTAAGTSTNGRNKLTVPGYIEGNTPITRINLIIGDSAAYSMPAGTKIELWGVSADE